MIANIFLIIFLLAMILWWATQGFFSSLLHLGITIAAGAIALAVWEPLAVGVLVYRMPDYAWTVGLLGPFILVLIGVRLLADKLVKGNVHVQGLLGQALGGFCGLISGVLTAGLTLIAMGFMPMGPGGVGGLIPYATAANGEIIESSPSPWIAVDKMTYGFYSFLSSGSFSPWSGASMAVYAPDLPEQANILRLRGPAGDGSSIVAVPEDITVDSVVVAPTPIVGLPDPITESLRPRIDQANFQLFVVDTGWQQVNRGTFDSDQTARIPATQVRLVTEQRQGGRSMIKRHPPIAIAKEVSPDNREYFAFNSDSVVAHSLGNDRLGWVFLIGADQEPLYLRVRNLRLPLPADSGWVTEPVALATILGQPPASDDGDGDTARADAGTQGTVGARDGKVAGNQATDIVLTNALVTAFSKNGASGLSYNGSAVTDGEATVTMRPGGLSKNTRADSVFTPGHLGMVRLKVDRDTGQSLLGQSLSAAASLGGVFLVDDRGTRHSPMAYNLVRKAGGQTISVNPNDPTAFRSARQLPITEMKDGDELYLFFRVPRGVTIETYEIGPRTTQDVNLVVPRR